MILGDRDGKAKSATENGQASSTHGSGHRGIPGSMGGSHKSEYPIPELLLVC